VGCHRALGRAYRNRQRRLGWVGRGRYAPGTAAFEGEAPGQRTTRGSLPVGRHAPAIAVLGDAEDLARGLPEFARSTEPLIASRRRTAMSERRVAADRGQRRRPRGGAGRRRPAPPHALRSATDPSSTEASWVGLEMDLPRPVAGADSSRRREV
jgi:hypothetical protein